jgi:hypothetical protein
MQACQYEFPYVDADWGHSRETHHAVAVAIHAIADSKRSPDEIWEAPTEAECDHVEMAIAEYIRTGKIRPDDDNRYDWGCGFVDVLPPAHTL